MSPALPREKWRKDSEGRVTKRKCRFCDKWHMDFNCPTKLASYRVSASYEQWHSSSDDADADSGESDTDDDPSDSNISSSSDSDRQAKSWKSLKGVHIAYHNVYSHSTTPPKHKRDMNEIKIPRASHYRIEELPIAFSVGTGVSYLSAQPCLVKAWVGTQPNVNHTILTGVVDSGGPSIIAKDLVPESFTILESPLKPVFAGIGTGRTPASGYVVLPVHLLNGAALSGNE